MKEERREDSLSYHNGVQWSAMEVQMEYLIHGVQYGERHVAKIIHEQRLATNKVSLMENFYGYTMDTSL